MNFFYKIELLRCHIHVLYTSVKYMQPHEETAIPMVLLPPKVWERFVYNVHSVLKRIQLKNFFHHIDNLHQNISFTMEEECNGELAFLILY